ncbi:hypothetical protein [Streptomyces naganishii]|uniref:hypothetical protein n=1 Tax=Streptomyces naganishii TaxID=285447 RepID=UPI00167EFAFE|nr:hypothetical protein [Streptomyces naganishii]
MVAIICASVMGTATACSKKSLAIPDNFCHVPVQTLSPLVPDGDSLKQDYRALEATPGAACNLWVDGHNILYADVTLSTRAPEPTNWNKVGTQYKHVAQRKVAFPGHAAIGSDHAIVEATCSKNTGYLTVSLYFFGDRVDDTPTGYKKLLRFVDDFVPKQTKKFGCTT